MEESQLVQRSRISLLKAHSVILQLENIKTNAKPLCTDVALLASLQSDIRTFNVAINEAKPVMTETFGHLAVFEQNESVGSDASSLAEAKTLRVRWFTLWDWYLLRSKHLEELMQAVPKYFALEKTFSEWFVSERQRLHTMEMIQTNPLKLPNILQDISLTVESALLKKNELLKLTHERNQLVICLKASNAVRAKEIIKMGNQLGNEWTELIDKLVRVMRVNVYDQLAAVRKELHRAFTDFASLNCTAFPNRDEFEAESKKMKTYVYEVLQKWNPILYKLHDAESTRSVSRFTPRVQSKIQSAIRAIQHEYDSLHAAFMNANINLNATQMFCGPRTSTHTSSNTECGTNSVSQIMSAQVGEEPGSEEIDWSRTKLMKRSNKDSHVPLPHTRDERNEGDVVTSCVPLKRTCISVSVDERLINTGQDQLLCMDSSTNQGVNEDLTCSVVSRVKGFGEVPREPRQLSISDQVQDDASQTSFPSRALTTQDGNSPLLESDFTAESSTGNNCTGGSSSPQNCAIVSMPQAMDRCIVDGNQKVSSEQKGFKCRWCTREFIAHHNLEKHVVAYHQKEEAEREAQWARKFKLKAITIAIPRLRIGSRPKRFME